jgi:hypothetical protein
LLEPAAPPIKPTAQQQNDDNNNEQRGRIHNFLPFGDKWRVPNLALSEVSSHYSFNASRAASLTPPTAF